ncbi:hypothetical protein [Haloferula sp.]|uniref:hypothetical protein n=1 Tax=Haloferula sp. TaxID=2497595 RepID=UPI003C7410F0
MHSKYKLQQIQQKRPLKGGVKQLDKLDKIASTMDAILLNRLPNGVIHQGILAGREPEIRQAALIKAIGGFLQKNDQYIRARKTNDKVAIRSAMARCAAITLKYGKAQVAREMSDDRSRFTPLNEGNAGVYLHPALLRPIEWQAAEIGAMVMISVRRAVRDGRLSPANAAIVSMACEEGLQVCQIARLSGITPSAVCQQLRRAKNVVPNLVSNVEQPLFA